METLRQAPAPTNAARAPLVVGGSQTVRHITSNPPPQPGAYLRHTFDARAWRSRNTNAGPQESISLANPIPLTDCRREPASALCIMIPKPHLLPSYALTTSAIQSGNIDCTKRASENVTKNLACRIASNRETRRMRRVSKSSLFHRIKCPF